MEVVLNGRRGPWARRSQAQSADSPDWQDVYRRWRRSALGAITDRVELEALRRFVGSLPNRVAVDIGCGDGTWALTLRELGAKVIAVDASLAMLRQARTRAVASRQDLALLMARAEQLPILSDRVDAAFAVAVLCHEPEPGRLVREMARVLRPGGQLILAEPGPWNLWAVWRRMRGWLGSSLWRRAAFRTPGRWRAILRTAGLTDVQWTGTVFYPPAAWAARLMAPLDGLMARFMPWTGALLLYRALKPGENPDEQSEIPDVPICSTGDQ